MGLPGAQLRIWLYRVPSLIGAIGAVLLTYWTALAFVTRRGAVLAGADDLQLRRAWRRSAAGENRCDAAAVGCRGDGRAGAGLSVLAARRGSRASVMDIACDLLDRAGRRRPAQGTVDPDVRRPDDLHAGVSRPVGHLALAAAAGMGPDVAAGSGAAVVRRDLLARRRCVFHGFDRRRHVEQARPRRKAMARRPGPICCCSG